MSFTKQQLRKFADSILIDIPDDKLEEMNVDQVYDWMAQMKKIDTTGVQPMFTPAQHAAPVRQDVVTDGNIRDAVLANAPEKINNYFAVPKVMDE